MGARQSSRRRGSARRRGGRARAPNRERERVRRCARQARVLRAGPTPRGCCVRHRVPGDGRQRTGRRRARRHARVPREAGTAVAEPLADITVRRRFDAIAPLRHPAYARLWTGAFVSNIGTWMETLALGVYVTKLTHQAAWTGTIAAAAFVPIAFFGAIGGALADRLPRKWLL